MYFWDKHKTIISYYELLSGEVCDRYGLTQIEYDILMFLHNNPQHNTAAEIVKIRKSTKSHVSTSLKALENKFIAHVLTPTSIYYFIFYNKRSTCKNGKKECMDCFRCSQKGNDF